MRMALRIKEKQWVLKMIRQVLSGRHFPFKITIASGLATDYLFTAQYLAIYPSSSIIQECFTKVLT